MASFLGKINRMRNLRLHAANEYVYPNSALYHEIVQGIPWTGGYTRIKPRRIDLNVDKLLSYVLKKRPAYRNYAWCPPDNGGVYVHPAVWTSERMQHHLDNNPHMNVNEAFSVADKEMSEKQSELDLQVSLAREHAARLGVNNQGVAGLFKRASVLYDAVYEMRYEEAAKTRSDDLADLCVEIAARGERLDMQDIIEIMPFKEEQAQFFKDYPEHRELFPPLWYIAEEVVQAQVRETSQRTGEAVRGERQPGYVEEDPNGTMVDKWPPQYIFDRETRNNEKRHVTDGVSMADAELLIAQQEALKYKIKEYQASQTKSSEYEPEEGETVTRAALVLDDATAEKVIGEAQALGETIYKQEEASDDYLAKALKNSQPLSETLMEDNSDFYAAYHEFLRSNSRDNAKAPETNSEYQKVLSERDRAQSDDLLSVAQKYLSSGNSLDAEAISSLKKDIREQLGENVEESLFDLAEGGGAVSAREFGGYAPFDEFSSRKVDLTSNLELSPFYPENAFPPKGITADPNLNLNDPASLTKEQQEQLESLKAFGAKYAHAIEDHAPVKSKAYVEESLKWGTPIVAEHIPSLQTNLESQTKELLSVKKAIEGEGEPKTLEEYMKKETTKDSDVKSSIEVQTEAALKALKQQMLDELASKAFSSEEERKDYEHMLEKRYDYLAAKKKEVYEQWAQYWPSDKPEALIYRGPETIREIFPEAYRLAVNRQYEELTGLPLNEALTIKNYTGLWKSVRSREKADPKIRDLDEDEWQHKIELDPAYYKTSTPSKKE